MIGLVWLAGVMFLLGAAGDRVARTRVRPACSPGGMPPPWRGRRERRTGRDRGAALVIAALVFGGLATVSRPRRAGGGLSSDLARRRLAAAERRDAGLLRRCASWSWRRAPARSPRRTPSTSGCGCGPGGRSGSAGTRSATFEAPQQVRGGFMAGLMSRFTTLFKVKANKALDKAEDPGRDPRLQLPEAAGDAAEGQARRGRRGHGQEAAAAADGQARAERCQAGQPGQAGAGRRQRGSGPHSPGAQDADPEPAAGARPADHRARAAAAEPADQQRRRSAKVESFRTQKEVVKAQYSAAEASVRIGEATTGPGRGDVGRGHALQRAQDKTEQMQARARPSTSWWRPARWTT